MQSYFRQSDAGGALLDLREAAQARCPDLVDLPVLEVAERQSAVATWRGRMVHEHISAQVWAGLVAPLTATAVPPSVLAALPAAIADELRHAEQCAGVVLALGGEPVAPLPPLYPLPPMPTWARWRGCCDTLRAWCDEVYGADSTQAMICAFGRDLSGTETGCIPWGPPVPPPATRA